jgi:transcriptional regulator with XRE-family HTH domain
MNNGQFLKEIGIKVKTARKAKKITLMELSKSCGIHITQLSFLENGKCNSHILTLKGIADVLSVDLKDLV